MSRRILIVEDEENNLLVISEILEYFLGETDLLFARDGHAAVTMAYQHRPDVIVMDLSLPKLSGWEVVRSLRRDRTFQETPILALTAHAMVGDRERALAAGCTDYFTKPIDIDKFVKFMKPYLAEPGPQKE